MYIAFCWKKSSYHLPLKIRLRYGFSHETIYKVYELPFQIKNDIAITMFQYKIIHNILATKVVCLEPNFVITMYALNA